MRRGPSRRGWVPATPPRAEQEPRPIRESLGAVAHRLGLPDPGVLGRVFTHWEELVGPEVAAHATPRSLRDGTLAVVVDHPAWASSLRMLSGDLVRRAESAVGPGAVTDVVVSVADPGRRQGGKPAG
ncbi:MAG TPA: DUF721 domain-containing protein [Acidimicrobiales bacterium]|nr:DUF721 domain-containing protein [Acidimicrobiales bacterium]